MAEEHDETVYDENSIQVLTEVEAVRKRPGMYFGGTGVEAIEHMVSEFVSNVIDLYLSQNATWVRVAIDGDMIEVSERTRAGCSTARVCTIIPPMEKPQTWALSMPR